MATAIPHYTADEVRQFDDPRLRFEVIRGELFVTPGPGAAHQLLAVDLSRALGDYLDEHRLGRVLTAPFEVLFSDDTAVQPDLLVVLDSARDQLTRDRHLGAPALVIEIISYSSKRTDRIQKRALYMEEGVPEYWIVDPSLKQVERWRAGDEKPEILRDRLEWRLTGEIPALAIDLPRVFARSEVQ